MVPRLSTESSPSHTPTESYVPSMNTRFTAALLALVFADGCTDKQITQKPVTGVKQVAPVEVVETKDPLFSEMENDASVLGTMMRFSLMEGDASMGIFIENNDIIIRIESDDMDIPHTSYVVRYASRASMAYDASDAMSRSMIGFLKLDKVEDGMEGSYAGITEGPFPEDILQSIIRQLSIDQPVINKNGQTQVDIDHNNTKYMLLVTEQ